MEEGKLDLALVTTEPSYNKLKYILIENESYVLLSSWEGPLSGRCRPGDSVSLMDIANERFVALKPGHNIRGIQDRVFALCGISPNILVETDSVEAAIRITVACGCCMLCPQVFVRSDPAIAGTGVCYQVKELSEARHFYACYQREKYLPAYTHTFIEMVQEATKESRLHGHQGAAGA